MACDNKVTFYVPRGYSHRAVEVPCGRTDPWGGRAVCDTCDELYGEQIAQEEAAIAADNAASRSAGWGDW